jgi:CRP-like cAMP-binding protein
MQYKANSVIYFKGDAGDKIFILKSGRVSLTSNDIETGQEIHDYIQTGEFFGVKSAMGRYPREENAVVLSDAHVIMFTVPEFEAVVAQNTRVIMKMLKVFSNQLRRLHAKVRSLLSQEEQVDPEEGLFRNGEYFMKRKQYSHALYAFNKYLTYYPSGRFHVEANKLAQTAEDYAQRYGHGKGPAAPGLDSGGGSAAGSSGGPAKPKLTDAAKRYYEAVSLFSQQRYNEALREFKEIAKEADDEEYHVKSLFEIGRCLYSMNQHDAAIKHFTGVIQRYPKLPDLKDALYYVGQCYQAKGDSTRAGSFFRKILSMPQVEEGLKRKVNKAIRTLEAAS